GVRARVVTGVQTCALPISRRNPRPTPRGRRRMSIAGRYRLEEVIGVGSFFEHLDDDAVDDRLDSRVVIKMLAENHSLNPEIRERDRKSVVSGKGGRGRRER